MARGGNRPGSFYGGGNAPGENLPDSLRRQFEQLAETTKKLNAEEKEGLEIQKEENRTKKEGIGAVGAAAIGAGLAAFVLRRRGVV